MAATRAASSPGERGRPRAGAPSRASLLAAAVAAGACDGSADVSDDPFPIGVDVVGGAVLATVRVDDGTDRVAVVELLSPLTVLDAPDDAPPSRRAAQLVLLGARPDGPPVARARLALTVAELHPCPAGEPCRVGDDATPAEIGAVLGADAFDDGALRVDFSRAQLQRFADVAGADAARGELCEAVMPAPFRGGGTLSIGGARVEFPARRIALEACAGFEAAPGDGVGDAAGADLLLALSTGLGPTVLSESAYERWRQASGAVAPAVDALPRGGAWLPSGRLEGALGAIDRLALVGTDAQDRGPCRQLWAHRLLTADRCQPGQPCPCADGVFCRVPAVVELTPAAPLEVLVVPDADVTLQALREELRPEAAEVDGLLGTHALAALSLDVDVPHDRLLLRCEQPEGCAVRPELLTEATRPIVEACLEVTAADREPAP